MLALTAAVPNGEEVLRSLVWAHFPHAFGGPAPEPLPPVQDWTRLRLLPDLAAPSGSAPDALPNGIYLAEPNEDGVVSFRLDFRVDRRTFGLADSRGNHEVQVGLGRWLEGETTISGAALHHGYDPGRMRVVAGGRWLDAQRFEMTWQFNKTAFRDRVVLTFDPGSLMMERSVNTNSGPCIRPVITAHLIP